MSDTDQISSGRRSAIFAITAAVVSPLAARAAEEEITDTAPGNAAKTVGLDELFKAVAGDSRPDDGRRGFDFLHGRWAVAHRNRKPLDETAPWQEFTGVVDCRPVVGGLVNVDDNILRPNAGPYRAATLRTFDPAQKLWSIYWISEKSPKVDPYPLQGNFRDGVGIFYADDPSTNPTMRTRFIWHRITAQSARWEQALSVDTGLTWIDNWFMDFSRVA